MKMWACFAILASLLLAGCKGIATKDELEARHQAEAVAGAFRPQGEKPKLPTLTTNSSQGDFLRFAMLNQPQVEAAYEDWLGSIERITVERSMPDPKLTFQAYIQDVLTSVMPGLMQEIPGPGKLKAAARVASAESQSKYVAFESSVLQTALALKRAYYQLLFLNEKVRVNRETLKLLADLETSARDHNE